MPAGIYRKYFFVLILALLFPLFVSAQVSQIVFTTDPQTVKPNELSGPLTIQTQDSSGGSYKTPETIDLEFISTSPSGEFLGSTGNPATKTMSTNTSNRTFYYRDSGLGAFTLTVNAKGRTSGTTWSAGQTITVSDSVSTTTTSGATSTVLTTSSGGATLNTSSRVIISTHYIAVPLTNTEADAKLEVGAGRDRLSTVGTPIEFRAESNRETNNRAIFQWSFGDGTVGNGEVTNHSYFYPGEYVVVLNASGPDGQAVSRSNVRIVPAELFISFASPERIEIMNNSKSETNLFGRAIVSGSRIFVFPQDTIIKAGQNISFSGHLTGLVPFGLTNVSLVVVGTEVRPQIVMAKIEEQKLEQIAQIHGQISILQTQLAQLSSQQNIAKSTGVVTSQVTKEPTVEKFIESENDEPQTALAIEAIPESTTGVMNKWLETLKRFFFRTRE